MNPRTPGLGRVMTSGAAELRRAQALAVSSQTSHVSAVLEISPPSDRRRFLTQVAAAVVALAIPPLFPAPARDLFEHWTEEELDAWQQTQVLRMWQEDPWRLVSALLDLGVEVPDDIMASATRRARRVAA